MEKMDGSTSPGGAPSMKAEMAATLLDDIVELAGEYGD